MRRAFTLVEMIVAISVGATLMGIAMSLLLVMFRTEQNGRSQLAQAESLERLANQFRQDVHAAIGRTVPSGKDLHDWRFDLTANRSVQYRVAENAISREQRSGAKQVRRESFRLPQDSTVAIAVDRAANPPLVSLTIEAGGTSSQPGCPFRVDAVLGRDLRFSGRRKEAR